jgi:hypothetical protein
MDLRVGLPELWRALSRWAASKTPPQRGIMALFENYSSRFCTRYHILSLARVASSCRLSTLMRERFLSISLVEPAGIKGAYGPVCSLLGV